MRVIQLVALVLAASASGCVVSNTPVRGLGERAAPIASGTTVAIFERADAASPWKPGEQKTMTLVAGDDRVYRSVGKDGKPEDDGIVFYSLGPDRYLVEAQFSKARYGFAVLRVSGGEAFVSPLACKSVADDMLKKSGMKMVADDCWLEDTKDPAEFLKSIAARAPEPTVKYVPVKPK